jgi:putative glutamine amidotransferase
MGPGPNIRPKRPQAYVGEAVIEAIRAAGGVPLLLPPGEQNLKAALQGVGAVVITGGDFDIHPRHYGHEPHPQLGRVDDKRTLSELALGRTCLQKDIPVLGICGGMQALAVVAGGTLHQHIDGHTQTTDPAEGWHALRCTGVLEAALGSRPVVNSTHHQAVDNPGAMQVVGTAEDGHIEAIAEPNHPFCLGVQWHPELLQQARLFELLLEAGRRARSSDPARGLQ